MTGPEHYQEAERLIRLATGLMVDIDPDDPFDSNHDVLAAAQVHATLALAAATALHTGGINPNTNLSANEAAWAAVAEVKPS